MPTKNRHQIGEVRIVDGKAQIFAKRWLSYPELASDLITTAYEHGWLVDDGLPHLKIQEDGYPSLRILLSRTAGRMARDLNKASPNLQFHITWFANTSEWVLGPVYIRVDGVWDTSRISEVTRYVSQYALRIPNLYVKADN